jgi:hypothetical protein
MLDLLSNFNSQSEASKTNFSFFLSQKRRFRSLNKKEFQKLPPGITNLSLSLAWVTNTDGGTKFHYYMLCLNKWVISNKSLIFHFSVGKVNKRIKKINIIHIYLSLSHSLDSWRKRNAQKRVKGTKGMHTQMIEWHIIRLSLIFWIHKLRY